VKLEKQSCDTEKLLNDMGRSVGSLREKLSLLKNERNRIPKENITAIRNDNSEIKKLEKEINKLETINGSMLKYRLQKQQELHQALQQSNEQWLRFVVATSAGLFSILVSLSSKVHIPSPSQRVFVVAMALLAVGILFLAVALYERPYIERKGLEGYAKATDKFLNSPSEYEDILQVRIPKIFSICRAAGYISLLLALVLLPVYVGLIYW
jgi:hypothetical protein